MKITENKIINTILLVACLLLLVTQYNASKRENYLKNNYAFTVGKTIRYSRNDHGGNNYIKYRYYVDGLTYFHLVCDNYEKGSPLKKFFKVKYSKIKPEISEMLLDEEVIDSTVTVVASTPNTALPNTLTNMAYKFYKK